MTFGRTAFSSIPLIEHYNYHDYSGGPENWSAVQNELGHLFVANQTGVLVFDGVNWRKIKIRGKQIFSLCFDEVSKKIYVGAFDEYGFLQRSDDNSYYYTSLSDQYQGDHDIGPVWKVVVSSGRVIFQSERKLFEYSNETIKTFDVNCFVRGLFEVNDRIFVVDKTYGLLEYAGNGLINMPNGDFLTNDEVNVVLPAEDGGLVISSEKNKGFYHYDFHSFVKCWTNLDEIIKNYPFNYLRLKNSFLIGTTEKGFYEVSSNGSLLGSLNVDRGLQYNKVFGLYEDHIGNVWVCYEDGIDQVAHNVPVRFVNKRTSVPGQAKDVTIIDDIVYFLTSTGVYHKHIDSLDIGATGGVGYPVWNKVVGPQYFLKPYNGGIAYGNIFGLFLYKNGKTLKLIDEPCFAFLPIPNGRLLAATDKGLCLLSENEGDYKVLSNNEVLRGVTELGEEGGNFYAIDRKHQLQQFHIYNNLIERCIDENCDNLNSYENAHLYFINDKLFVSFRSQLFQLSEGQLKNDSVFQSLEYHGSFRFVIDDLNGGYLAGREASEIEENGKTVFEINSTNPNVNRIFTKSGNLFADNYYVGSFLRENIVCLGGYDGFVIVDLSGNWENKFEPVPIITLSRQFRSSRGILAGQEDYSLDSGKPIVSNKYNNLSIEVSYPSFLLNERNSYLFELQGSDYSQTVLAREPKVTFVNISSGNYVVVATITDVFGNVVKEEVLSFSILSPWYTKWWVILLAAIAVLVLFLLVMLIQKRIAQRQRLALQKEVYRKTEDLHRHMDTLEDNIRYAKLIQDAVLPNQSILDGYFSERLMINIPRDIVGGDFFWAEKVMDRVIVCLADCTGHGVSAGFITLLTISRLRLLIGERRMIKVQRIMWELNEELLRAFRKRENSDQDVLLDGLDAVLISYSKSENVIEVLGARRPVFLIRQGELTEISGKRISIGEMNSPALFQSQYYSVTPGDIVYVFTDGFTDQFGGPLGKKLGKMRLKKKLAEIAHLSMMEQKMELTKTFNSWKGKEDQVDDVLFVGLKVS